MVTVRPVIDDLVEGWVAPLVDALDPRVGDRIAVAGDDGATAGRVACNAAAWLADRGRSVTLVDASIEEPVVAKALPEDGDEGVVDVVNFGVSPDAVRRRTLATRVALVTSGSYAVSPHDVVASTTFGEMLNGYASGDVVVVVVPPDLLEDAAPAFNAVVVVGGSPDRLESNGARLSDAAARQPLHRVAVLTARPAAVAESVTFTGEASVVQPETEPEGEPEQDEASSGRNAYQRLWPMFL